MLKTSYKATLASQYISFLRLITILMSGRVISVDQASPIIEQISAEFARMKTWEWETKIIGKADPE